MKLFNAWQNIDIKNVPKWVKKAAYRDKENKIYVGKTFEYRVKWKKIYYNPHTEYHGGEEFPNMWNCKEIPRFESRFK